MDQKLPTIIDAAELGLPSLPEGKSVFHYTSAEGLRGIMDKRQFWVTECRFLNDMSEFSVGTEVVEEVIRANVPDPEAAARVCDKLRAEVSRLSELGEPGSGVAYFGDYVLSLSLDADSAILWSEFSDFQGYCIEFDLHELLASLGAQPFAWHGAVVYDHEEQVRLVNRMFQAEFFDAEAFGYLDGWDSFCALSDSDEDDVVRFLAVVCEGYNMFFKRECFAGEHEYRVVFSCIHDGGRIKEERRVSPQFRVRQGVFIPYVEMRFSPQACARSVTIGPKNASDIAVAGLRRYFRSLGLSIPVRKSAIPLRY